MGCKLNESIYIALTDHIHMSIHRIRNMVLQETQKFYDNEFQVGQKALAIMNERFNVHLPEDEIGFIALHLINAQPAQPVTDKIMQLIQEIINVVHMSCKTEFVKDSMQYYRFIAHLKFFVNRIFIGQQSERKLKKKFNSTAECANKIAELIETKYHYKVSLD